MDRGGEECGVVRTGCGAGEEGRFSWPGGVRAGLTGQRQRRLVPPGFLLKTRPPFPPRAPRSRVSSPSSATTLFFTSLSPPFVPSLLHPPVPPACSLFLAPFLHFSHFLSFLPSPPSSSGPLQTLSSGLRGGGGRLRRWDGEIEGGTKALRCSGPTRVAGSEKKPDGILMQGVDGQTRIDRQSRLSPLSSSFS